IRYRNVTGVQTCALPIFGFLRVVDGENPLDRTPIHPESYGQVEKLLKMVGFDMGDVGSDKLREKLDTVNVKGMTDELEIGEPTRSEERRVGQECRSRWWR